MFPWLQSLDPNEMYLYESHFLCATDDSYVAADLFAAYTSLYGAAFTVPEELCITPGSGPLPPEIPAPPR